MDSVSISRMAVKLLKNSGVRFQGVYPSDHLPCVYEISSRSPCCYVANSDPCNELGSHWVAFFHPTPNVIEFFDSFAKTPAYYGFSSLITCLLYIIRTNCNLITQAYVGNGVLSFFFADLKEPHFVRSCIS